MDECFLSNFLKEYNKASPLSIYVNRDGKAWYPPQDCQFINLKYHRRNSFEKIIINRTIQYIKDRTNNFMTILLEEENKM